VKLIKISIPILSKEELLGLDLGNEPTRQEFKCMDCRMPQLLFTNIPNYTNGFYLDFEGRCTCMDVKK